MNQVPSASREASADWLEDEETIGRVLFQQLGRMIRRARRRPVSTGGLALGIAAVLFAAQARRPGIHHAEVGLLITEGAFAADGRPRPRSQLLDFINNAVFTTPRLTELADKHDLMRVLNAPDPERVIERMRRSIEVYTWQDYFETYRHYDDPPRTVRVTVGFSAPDPGLALAVARDLGAMVAATQSEREIQVADGRVRSGRIVAGSAAARAVGAHEELTRAQRLAAEHPTGKAYVSLQRLTDAAKAADDASMAAAADLVDAELHASAIRRVTHLVQVVDPGAPLWQTLSLREKRLRQGILALLVGIFAAVIVVGAWDPSVRDAQDLRRLGLSQLGHVPVCGDLGSPEV